MLTRYRENLHIEGNKVISYVTHVATIDWGKNKLYVHGYWSMTTSKHINYVASEYGLTKEDAPRDTTPKDDGSSMLKTTAMVMAMGNLLAGDSQKEKNDWKSRMLKAGLGNSGLIMPEDWDSLTEDEKEKRLDGAIEAIK